MTKQFPSSANYSLKATAKEGIFTPKVTYLNLDTKEATIQANAGIRYWHLGQNLQFKPNIFNYSAGSSQNWVDVVAGASVVVPLSPKIAVMVLGDAGGGGAHVGYQVVGLATYQVKPKRTLGAGFRYLDVNYRGNNQFIFDTAQSGIALGLLYRFGKPLKQ